MSESQISTFRVIANHSISDEARDLVAAYRRIQQRTAAIVMVNRMAIAHLHELGSWRQEQDGDRFQLIQCRGCGEGARLSLEDAGVIFTVGFERPCTGVSGR
jgi:hypothetical protein